MIATIIMMIILLKLTGWFLRVCGRLAGCILRFLGFLFLGGLAVTAFSLAVVAFPIILVIGIITILFYAFV